MEEMRNQASRNKFGELEEINELEYKQQVTDAPADVYVVVFLYKPSIPKCQILEKHLRVMADKFK